MAITTNNIVSTDGTLGNPADMELAKEVFSGLVMEAFERKNIGLGLVSVMTIEDGSSDSFPVIAQAPDSDVAAYVVGTDVTTSAIPVKERIITITQPQYHAISLSRLEEKILHFEVRSKLAREMGGALATKIDKAVFAEVLTASQTSGTIGGEVMQPDGSEVNNDVISSGSTAEAKGDALFSAIFEADTLMDEKDVGGEKVFVTTKANFNYIVQSAKGINRDYTSGSNGGVDTGVVVEIAGIKIMWTNHLPVGTTVVVDSVNKHLQGLVFTDECVGVVKLMDVMTDIDALPAKIRQDVIKSFYWLGMGTLKPACATAVTGGTVA